MIGIYGVISYSVPDKKNREIGIPHRRWGRKRIASGEHSRGRRIAPDL